MDIGAYYNPIHLFFTSSDYCPKSVIIIEPILDALSVAVPCNSALNEKYLLTSNNNNDVEVNMISSDGPKMNSNKNNNNKVTYYLVLPITFRHYIAVQNTIPASLYRPDGIVCIGCDSHYGPNRHMLETTFIRPYVLYLEYPSEYVHNAAFRKMMGEAPKEKLTLLHKFQPNTNATKFTKRVMKIIEYSA